MVSLAMPMHGLPALLPAITCTKNAQLDFIILFLHGQMEHPDDGKRTLILRSKTSHEIEVEYHVGK